MERLATKSPSQIENFKQVWTPESYTLANYFEQPMRNQALERIIKFTKTAITNNLVLPENFNAMTPLLVCRNHSLPRNFFNFYNKGDIDPRNLAATEILFGEKQIPEKLSFEQYLEKYNTRISPVITDPGNIDPQIRERFPLWLQEIEQTYSKVNFAVLCQQIHSGNLQNFEALCNVLGYTDAKKDRLLKNLRKTLPESDFITNFENEESSLRDMLTKAITLAQKSPVKAVFIKNELAAGFGVVRLELEELENLLKIGNADELIEIYKKKLRTKISSKSPEFASNPAKLENHIQSVFCEWKCLGTQKALEIDKELSVQYINGKMVATTENLVNPINNQHQGNLVYPLGRIELELHESLQIAKLMMMCQFGGTGFEKDGVFEAIGRINSIPYSGVDLIKDSSGDVNLLEFNMRTTGVTPSLLRVVMNYLKTGYLPIEYLTQNVAFLNCEDQNLLNLAFNMRQKMELFGLDADFYSILTLPQECNHPLGQIIVPREKGETKAAFEIRCKHILSTTEHFEGKNQITNHSKNYYKTT